MITYVHAWHPVNGYPDAYDMADCAVTHTAVNINDNNACTKDTCNPVSGIAHVQIIQCIGGDGCCPMGCVHGNDVDCP